MCEEREDVAYNEYISEFKTLVRETILKDEDDLLEERVRDYCNKHHKIIDVRILKEVLKEAYKKKADQQASLNIKYKKL